MRTYHALVLKIKPQQTIDVNILEVVAGPICRKSTHKQSKTKKARRDKKV